MFAKLAQFRSLRLITARSGESHDRYSARSSFASTPRPALICRWVERRSGTLECTWHVEASKISAVNEPGNRSRFGRSRGSHQLAVVEKQPTRSAAA
jgi:hypothetical protein